MLEMEIVQKKNKKRKKFIRKKIKKENKLGKNFLPLDTKKGEGKP